MFYKQKHKTDLCVVLCCVVLCSLLKATHKYVANFCIRVRNACLQSHSSIHVSACEYVCVCIIVWVNVFSII